MAIRSRNILRIVIGTGLVLLVPLIAMQFTEEVNWSVFDFIIIGTLLIGAGFTYELVATRVNAKYRTLVAAVIAISVVLIWAELAVGVFGTPFAGS